VHASAEDLDEQLEVTGGVDTHLDCHVAAVLDHRGVELATKAFPTDRAGHQALLAWMTSFGTVAVIGVEGTGSYGAGLARFLAAEGVALVEVNRSNRQLRRRHGKSDPLDAVAAARAAQSGTATGHAKGRDGTVEAIRVLRVARRSARTDRVRAINQLKGLVATAPDELREPLRRLGRRQLVATCKAFRPGEDLSPVAATKYALRLLAQRVTRLETELEDLDEQLQALVEAAASALLAEHAVGTDTAGALLVAAGDNPKRLRSEAAFAQLCGVAPLPASSGRVVRHRLNRGGDRQANAALWRIVLIRLRTHQPTREYVQRRTAEGLSKAEIMRCLKRYVARELFPLIRDALTGAGQVVS